MKKRWIIGLIVFLVAATTLIPQAAADIDYFFSGRLDDLTVSPLEGWTAVLSGGKATQFYLFLAALVALLLAWVLFSSTYLNYRSNMQVVTPEIITPCADGQGQFGTAQWLSPEEYKNCFGIWHIRRKDSAFRELLDAGKRDAQEVHDGNV